ncbi:MAG: BolA family transcriptional regulator [Sneathiella sp.]|nr:BolA family transcriptional regulator [Sneathiella sp.]
MSVSKRIEEKLVAEFSPLKLNVIDESHHHAGHAGARPQGESHFRVEIISDAFTGLTKIARQRLIYKALKEEMDSDIHALVLVVKAPQE